MTQHILNDEILRLKVFSILDEVDSYVDFVKRYGEFSQATADARNQLKQRITKDLIAASQRQTTTSVSKDTENQQ